MRSRLLLDYDPATNEVRRSVRQAYISFFGPTSLENQERINYGDYRAVPLGVATPATAPASLSAYPNPSADGIYRIQLSAASGSSTLRIRDALGRECRCPAHRR